MFIKVIEVHTYKLILDGNFDSYPIIVINEFTMTRIAALRKNSTVLCFDRKIPEWIKPGIFLQAKPGADILTFYKCDQDKITKMINWRVYAYRVTLKRNLRRYKCTAYLTVLDHGDLSILVKENLNEFSDVFIGSIKSSEIINCDEGSIIYFKDKIDKIPECFEMITNEM